MTAALRFERLSLGHPGRPEPVSRRRLGLILSPAEIRLLEARPVATILSFYHVVASKASPSTPSAKGDTVSKKMTKTQGKRLILVNSHLLLRVGLTLPVPLDAGWLNEQLVLWLPRWLDELSDALTGEMKTSVTKETAARRCLAAITQTTGITFDQPRYDSVGVSMDKTISKKPTPAKPIKAAPVLKTTAAKPAAKPTAPKPITRDLGRAPVPAAGDGAHVIKVLTKNGENPKRVGTSAHQTFKLYGKGGLTVDAFLKKGGSRAALRYDVEHGFIKVAKP